MEVSEEKQNTESMRHLHGWADGWMNEWMVGWMADWRINESVDG